MVAWRCYHLVNVIIFLVVQSDHIMRRIVNFSEQVNESFKGGNEVVCTSWHLFLLYELVWEEVYELLSRFVELKRWWNVLYCDFLFTSPRVTRGHSNNASHFIAHPTPPPLCEIFMFWNYYFNLCIMVLGI